MVKCRYSKCKLGGKVERDEAVKDGILNFHQECYDKRKFKQDIKKHYQDNMKIFSKRDWDIALARMVDAKDSDIEYINFVARKMILQIESPYRIMYYMKFDKLKDEYKVIMDMRIRRQLNQEMKDIEIKETDFNFKYMESKPIRRYNIYKE